jgi:hypothetical protein
MGHGAAEKAVDYFRCCHRPRSHHKLQGCDDLVLRPGKQQMNPFLLI